MEKTQKTLGQLALPICFELLLLMLTGTIDTLMLSSVGDQAVAAVGTANTYISMFILMFSVISSGMMAVMTQNIGANKPGVAYQACKLGSILNAAFGIVLGVLLFTKAKTILELVGIASALKEPAAIYLSLVGGSCIFNAVIPIYSGYLRAFGYMKQPLWATIIANLTNLILNALFLFIFDMGVTGIAIATVISKALNFIIVYISSHILIQAHDKSSYLPSSQVLLQIVKIGLPSAMETVFYHISLALVMRYLNQMDSDGLNVAARSYSSTITNFSYCVGAALGHANAILTGWQIGSKEYDACIKGARKAAVLGIIMAVCIETLFAIFAEPLMSLFTDDPVLIDLVRKILFLDIILECGRVTNLVYVNALKVSGDVVFPVAMATLFSFVCAVGGAYLFGMKLEMMVVGAYIGLTLDECFRGIAMVLRWRSGIWKTKRIVKDA